MKMYLIFLEVTDRRVHFCHWCWDTLSGLLTETLTACSANVLICPCSTEITSAQLEMCVSACVRVCAHVLINLSRGLQVIRVIPVEHTAGVSQTFNPMEI